MDSISKSVLRDPCTRATDREMFYTKSSHVLDALKRGRRDSGQGQEREAQLCIRVLSKTMLGTARRGRSTTTTALATLEFIRFTNFVIKTKQEEDQRQRAVASTFIMESPFQKGCYKVPEFDPLYRTTVGIDTLSRTPGLLIPLILYWTTVRYVARNISPLAIVQKFDIELCKAKAIFGR